LPNCNAAPPKHPQKTDFVGPVLLDRLLHSNVAQLPPPPPPPLTHVPPFDARVAMARVPDVDVLATPAELPRIRMMSADIDDEQLVISNDADLMAGVRSAIEATVESDPTTMHAVMPPPPPPAPPAPQPVIAPTTAADPYAPSAELLSSIRLAPQRPAAVAPAPASAPLPLGHLDDTAHQKRQQKAQRRKKRGAAIRRFISFVVLLGLLGGAAYGVKRYVLDPRKASPEAKAVTSEVEALAGTTFERPLKIRELPAAEFGVARATALTGIESSQLASTAGAWRAAGLINGDLSAATFAAWGESPTALGAAATSMAFYDWTTGEIVVRADATPAVRTHSVRHAAAVALVAQRLDSAVSPSQRSAQRVFADSIADSVAAKLAAADDAATKAELKADVERLVATAPAVAVGAPFATLIAGGGPTLEVGQTRALAAGDVQSVLTVAFSNDGGVFDPFRGIDAAIAAPAPAGSYSMGMMFWYHSLAGRIDDRQAWGAALAWAGDATTVKAGAAPCFESTISAFDPAGAAALKNAFDAWVAASPANAQASVTTSGEKGVLVKACDPGVLAPNAQGTVEFLAGSADVELLVLSELLFSNASAPKATQQCVVLKTREAWFKGTVDAAQVKSLAASCG
jgi:hypothetical protein